MCEQILRHIKNQPDGCKVLLTETLLKFSPKIKFYVSFDDFLDLRKEEVPLSQDRIFCVIDFSGFEKYEESAQLSFRELLKKQAYFKTPLSVLNQINILLKPEGLIVIFPLIENFKKDIIIKFLKCAKFDNVNFDNNLITAQKRDLKKYVFDHGRLTFEETNSPEMIRHIQYFAKGLFKNYNFDFSVDNFFVPHSDFFVCYRTESREIITFLRYTWHLPKHYLPCMLATKINDGNHLKLDNPDIENYGEIFAPYINSLSAVKSYKELIKNILEHCLNVEATCVFTTYDKLEPLSAIFFNKVFGFKDTSICLHYGDFGGEWGLMSGGKKDIIPVVKDFIKKTSP